MSANLKLHIDTYHMNIEEDQIGRNIAAAGRHIGHVHIADSNRGYPGTGHYDFMETIAALKAIGYRGALACRVPGNADSGVGGAGRIRRDAGSP